MIFKKYKGNPILRPNPKNAWESLVVCNPGAWYENGTFYLLYRAAGNDREHYIHIGLATSKDGFHFERVSDKPVLSPSPDSFDSGCVEDPRIVKFGDTFYVTYAYRPFPPGRYWENDHQIPREIGTDDYAPVGLRENKTNTGLAISKDLRRFKKLGRITRHDLDDRDVILFPEKINGQYVLLHRPMEWVGKEYGCDVPSIWISFSDDVMVWSSSQLLLTRQEEWESLKIGGSTPPLKTEAGWLVFYHGVSAKDRFYRVGALLLDINDPTKIIARSKQPIMEPEYNYELDGFYQGCVFPTGNVIVGDTLYLYYGGADRYVNVATCRVSELINYLLNNNKVIGG